MADIKGLKFTENILYEIAVMGGEHSGHHGHAGRPGQVGGSLSGGIAVGPTEVSEEVADAFGAYTGDYYDHINQQLRGTLQDKSITDYDLDRAEVGNKKEYREKLDDYAELINSEILQHKVTKSTELYRGLDASHLSEVKEGDTFKESAFTSATTDVQIAEGNISGGFKLMMMIHLKSGNKAMDLTGWSLPKEFEWLLPKGSSFKLLKESSYFMPGKASIIKWDVEVI